MQQITMRTIMSPFAEVASTPIHYPPSSVSDHEIFDEQQEELLEEFDRHIEAQTAQTPSIPLPMSASTIAALSPSRSETEDMIWDLLTKKESVMVSQPEDISNPAATTQAVLAMAAAAAAAVTSDATADLEVEQKVMELVAEAIKDVELETAMEDAWCASQVRFTQLEIYT